MIINKLDLGDRHAYPSPIVGQNVAVVVVEGYEPSVYSHGSRERQQAVSFWIRAWQAIGGQSADTAGAMKYLLKQVEELASSRDQQPVYIQWTATAMPNAGLNTSELHDGWYYIDDLEPDYHGVDWPVPFVQCRMTVTQVAAAAPRSVALDYKGAALSTNYSGTALNLISLPVGSAALEASFTRTGGEGAIPCILSPVASPEPMGLSPTLANIFKGGVHVYDTINTGSNPVPTSGGTFVHANWVEVFYTDHDFIGDCVITSGLRLILIPVSLGTQAAFYLWNTALAVANWQQDSILHYLDNASNSGVPENLSLVRVGPEECAVSVIWSTGAQMIQLIFRLQRGHYEIRGDLRELTQTNSASNHLFLAVASTPKILYNSANVTDNVTGAVSLSAATDYGYAAAFAASTSFPFINGFLYQNQPAFQPITNASANVGLGDTSGPAVNTQRSYGFFAVPYGVSGSYSTANLQAEAESGLTAPWVTTADGTASAGNSSKLPSGTAAAGAQEFGSSIIYAPGAYDAWFRVKVTAANSASAQLRIGVWDVNGAVFLSHSDFSPNQIGTSWTWVKSSSIFAMATGMRFGVQTILTSTTDIFIDEAVLLPHTLTTANTGPQDLWQQWSYDRSTKWIRP